MTTERLQLSILVLAMLVTLAALARGRNQPLQAQAASSPQQTEQPAGSAHEGMAMGGTSHVGHDMGAENNQDVVSWTGTEWSIFNHRVAGWFIFFWGLTAFIAGVQWPRKTWWRYAPAMMVFGLAEFLFFRNDPTTWPIGRIGLWASLHDAEDLQHRIFLVLIVVIAVVELLRAADRLPPLLAKYSLPALCVVGCILLLNHQHGGPEMEAMMSHWTPDMASDPAMARMMAQMNTVKHEHMWFAILGACLIPTRIFADTGHLKGRWGAILWTIPLIALGIYMLEWYVE